MYLIAGLGNPGKQYEKTRHNMGFDCIDILSEKLDISLRVSRFSARVGKGRIGTEQVLLIKPQTYMNLSGNAVGPMLNYYKIDPKSGLIVIYDDTDLDIGHLRVRKKGSAGSHNGMKSVIAAVGTEEFVRIRVGIGRRKENEDMVNFVLGRFGKEERLIIDETLKKAADCAVSIVEEGADRAMNKYNG